MMATPTFPPAEETHLSMANDECLSPLKTSTSIRLIDLESGEQDSDIMMSVNIYDLLDPPQYVALSYTWGDPLVHPYVATRPSRIVWIDTTPFLVTHNLYDALNHWRGWKLEVETAKTLLWIDAICINQDDLIERNHQVALMGQIYSKATLVIAWAGPSDEDAWIAFKQICRLKPIVELWQSDKSKFMYFHNSDKLFERVGVSMVRPKEWEALISFYERQYFNRAWIVQEIILAKAALLMFGHYFIHWTDLMNLSEMMFSCKWIPILQRYARPSTEAERPQLTLGAPAVYNKVRFLYRQYSPSERGQSQYPTTHSDASLLRPDYRIPVHKVFIDVTREVVTKTCSASILSLIDHDSKQTPDLSSWVPDYSASDSEALAYICQAELYSAFNLVQRSLEPTIVDDVFSLCAMRWDAIADIELTERPFALQGQMDLCLQLPQIYRNGQTRIEALWRTLIGDTDGQQSPAPETIGNSFRQYVLLAIATRVSKILEGWDGRELEVRDFTSLLELNNGNDGLVDPWLPGAEEVESFWNTLQTMQQRPRENERLLRELGQGAHSYAAAFESIGRDRKLFKTCGNLLGLAPVSAKRGDTVWFFPSSRVPFVLRRYGSKQYKLIGEAYLHGYMHRELENFSMPLQYISLV